MDVIASEAKQSPSFGIEIATAYYVGLAMTTPQIICDRLVVLGQQQTQTWTKFVARILSAP